MSNIEGLKKPKMTSFVGLSHNFDYMTKLKKYIDDNNKYNKLE